LDDDGLTQTIAFFKDSGHFRRIRGPENDYRALTALVGCVTTIAVADVVAGENGLTTDPPAQTAQQLCMPADRRTGILGNLRPTSRSAQFRSPWLSGSRAGYRLSDICQTYIQFSVAFSKQPWHL
jgi:hypothetical protein